MNKTIHNLLSEAGEILKEQYFENQTSRQKKRWDMVTETDVMIEQMLVNGLRESFGDDAFIGEECGNNSGSTGRSWIIDPIDGTTNFIMGKPYFSISLALEHEGEIIEGYVYNPVSNELYYSTKSLGVSFLNDQVISVSQTDKIEDSLIAFGFSARMDAIQRYYQDWPRLFTDCRKGVGWIAPALSICNVARGRIDAFIDYGASIYGQSAASLILKNAGGELFNSDMSAYSHQLAGIIAITPKIEAEIRNTAL